MNIIRNGYSLKVIFFCSFSLSLFSHFIFNPVSLLYFLLHVHIRTKIVFFLSLFVHFILSRFSMLPAITKNISLAIRCNSKKHSFRFVETRFSLFFRSVVFHFLFEQNIFRNVSFTFGSRMDCQRK